MWVSEYSGGYSGGEYGVGYGGGEYGVGYGGGGYAGGRGLGRAAGDQAPPPAPPPVYGNGGYNGVGYAGGGYAGGVYAHGGYAGGGSSGGGYAMVQTQEGNCGGEYNGIDIGSNNTSELEGNDVKLRFDLSKLKDVPKLAGGVRVGSGQYSKNKVNRIDYSEFNDPAPAHVGIGIRVGIGGNRYY